MFLKKIIVLLLVFSLLGNLPQRIAKAELEITEQSYVEQIDYFAEIYNVDSSLIRKIVDCESGGKINAIGDGHRSHGIAQFQKATWDLLEKKYYDKYNQHLDYQSSFDQIALLTFSVANGYGTNWTSFVAIKNGGKYSFWSSQMNRHYTIYCRL